MRTSLKLATIASFSAALMVALYSGRSAAFDHVDDTRVAAAPATDITDIFAFPVPNQTDAGFQKGTELALVMGVNPGATTTTRFDSSLTYTFEVRPIFEGLEAVPVFGADIVCTFSDGTPQKATCGANGIFVTSTVGDTASGDDAGKGVKLFAGLRSDPAFADVAAIRDSFASGTNKLKTTGTNTFQGKNVLAIVVVVDIPKLLPQFAEAPGFPMFAVSGTVSRK